MSLKLNFTHFCQNPNTTTTQPNLNQVVGLDTIFAVHHHICCGTSHICCGTSTGTLLLIKRMILGVWNFIGDLTLLNYEKGNIILTIHFSEGGGHVPSTRVNPTSFSIYLTHKLIVKTPTQPQLNLTSTKLLG